MENEIFAKSKGGRPCVSITRERLNKVIKMTLRGFASTKQIAEELGISKNAAVALRKRAINEIQEHYSDRKEIYRNKALLVLRVEDIISNCWNFIEQNDYNGRSWHANLSQILKALRLLAEITGAKEERPGIIINSFSLEQKIVMNILNLDENDFKPENYERTIKRLTDFYRKTAESKGNTGRNSELVAG